MNQLWLSAPQDLQQFKIDAIAYTGLGRDALHVYFGLALFIAVRLLWRWRFGWILAWLAALALAVGVEYLDIKAEHTGSYLQPEPAHWHDVWNTMVWPTVLLLIGRWLHPRPKVKAEPDSEAEKTSSDLADQSFKEPPPV
jgi:hypothetical protein